MIVKQKSKVIPIEKSSTHYKMYKGGKLWLTAGITTLSMAGMMVAAGELQTAHADTTTTANNTQQTATGGNAVTATTSGTSGQAGTITQPVNVDHSQLNNAVDQARQAGLAVNQQPTTTQTVSQDQVDAAKQNIQNDETKQAQQIQTITRQHQTEVSNVNNFNGSKGDTSQLDAKVQEAQSVPGLTVVHDQDQTTVKKASDTQGIQEAVNNATQSNNDQAQSVQNAIDTQKRNNAEFNQASQKYQAQLKKYQDTLSTSQTIVPDQIIQGLKFQKNSNAQMKVEDLQPNQGTAGDGRWYSNNINGDFLRAIYTNINGAQYTDMNGNVHNINKMIVTYSNLILGPRFRGMKAWFRPATGTGWGDVDSFYIKSVNATYQFYDGQGNLINFAPGTAWLFLSSLTRWANNNDGNLMVDPSQDHVEAVKAINGSKLYNLPEGKAVVHNDGNAYEDATIYTQRIPYHPVGDGDNGYDHDGGAVIASVSNGMTLQWNLQQNYDPNNGKDKADSPSFTGSHEDAKDGGWYYFSIKNNTLNGISMIPPTRKNTEVHYHYNTVNVLPPATLPEGVSYQLHDLNVKTTPEKNWVNGIQSVNNKVGINDDVVTTKVDMNYLGSNQIEGGLHSLKVTDDYSKFANDVDYAGAQVYENEELATGNYDITNNGQQVTATRKNPESANGGKVSLVIDFKIKPNVKTGTVFENSGSGTINDQTVPTNDAQIKTYEQETVKHWMEGKNIVDDKTEINGDIVTTQVHMTLPDQSTLIAPLSYVSIDDNYTDFADKTNLLSYQLWENGANATDQYNVVNENGHLVAVRKNASAAPAGEVVLIGTFKINDNVPNGTKLVNRGSGRLNNHTVETNTPAIVTFTQSVDKHWVEGSNTVDTKTYIADDVATTNITTTLPDPNSLAKPLTYLSIDDDYTNFMDKAKLQSYQVWEGNNNVTSQYTVTDNNGHLTARRNDPSKAPGGTLRLVAVWKINDNVPSGTKLVNTGSSRINNHTVEAGKPYVVVYTQTTDKHWVDGNQVVDDKTYVDGDNVNGQVTMSLPNPSDLAKPLSNVIIRDDYTKFANDVDYKSATVTENDNDATDQYNIVNENGVVTATRKNPGAAPAGKVQLNVIWTTHTGLPSGTKLVNSGSGTINGKTVNTPDRTIYTFHNDSDKHWVEGNRKVDGLTRINDDLIHAEISTVLPDPSQLAKKLGEIQLVDDWSDFKDKAKVTSYRVTENDKDATNQYNVVVDNNGFVTATRKDASTAPGGTAKLLVDWKINHDVASGTKLHNTGYTLVNKSKVKVPTVDTVTFTPKTDKHWIEGNTNVDDHTYVSGDEVHGNVSMTLPNPSTLAKPLSKVIVIDDYRDFMDKVTYDGANVYEGDKDVTALYDVVNKDGVVTATRKNAATTPGGIVYLKPNWKLNTNLPNGTKLVNRGSGQINDDLVPTPDRNIYVFTQTATKHWKVGTQNVDSKTAINDDVIHAEISMSLPNPNSLANPLTDVEIEDDYTNFVNNVGLPTVKLYENGQDTSGLYNVTLKNGIITASRKDPSKTPGGILTMNVAWKINHDVASGTEFTNKGTGTINHSKVKTNQPEIISYTPQTDKHWSNNNDQNVDNKVFIAGDDVSSKVSMTLPEPSNLAEKLKNVQVIDNFHDFADKVDLKGYSITENGKDANDLYNFEVTKDHQIIATRKDPTTTPGGIVILRAQWTLHKDIPTGTVLTNKGSGQINDDLVPTPDRTITTYTQDTEKHWRNNGGQIVDGKVAINDGVVTARVDMTLPKAGTLGSDIHKIQLTDDFTKFAKDVETPTLENVHVYEGDKDVTDAYDIYIDPNGKVVATRKNPDEVNNHQGELPVTMRTAMDAKDSLDTNDLAIKASGNLNNNLFAARAGLFNASFIQTHVSSANGKINSQVDMQLPETSEGVNKVAVTDDYTNFSKYAQPGAVHVYEDGKEATANYTVSDDGAGHVTATRNDTENLNGGQVSMKVDYKIKGDIPNGTVLENHGSGTINDETIPTNTPSITTYTQEAEKHWVEDDQIVDGRVVIDGSVAHAKVTTTLPDPSQLTDPLTNMSIKDDYSKFAKDVDLTDVQVLENGKLATSEYSLEKGDGFVVATRKDPAKTPGGNAQLLLTFNIHKDVPNGTKLENAGSSTINNHTVKTNTPWIETFLPNPTKDVVISVDNQKSLNGQKIELGQHFDYKLVGSQLPASVTALNEYGFHDDYDETHDQYNASYTVLLNDDITLKNGTVLQKNTDVTKYTTQVVDTENGKVDIEFDKSFLASVDLSKSSFGATAYLKMKRVKSGTVQNKYTNSINNIDFSSNTVTTTTEEPKKPETPSTTPKTPETPVTPTETPKTTPTPTPAPQVTPVQEPVMAAVATPAQVATPAPQQPSSAAPQEALPQTGNANESGLVAAGLAGFLISLGAFSLKKKRN